MWKTKDIRLGYWIALFAVLAILLGLVALRPVFGNSPPIDLLLVATMFAAWMGGLRPGLIALGLSIAAAWSLFEPGYLLRAEAASAWIRLLLLAFMGLTLAVVIARIRAAECRALELLSQRERELSAEVAGRKQAEAERESLLTDELQARREAEAARGELMSALALNQALFENAPVGLAVVDPELRYVRVNEPMARFNRMPVAEHAGRPVGEMLFEAYDVGPILESLRKVLESGESELNLQVPAVEDELFGVMRCFNASFFPIRTGLDVLGVGAVVEEVTERRQAQAEIEDLNAALFNRVDELETLFDLAPVGLLLAEDKDCRRLRMNKAFAAMLGVPEGIPPSLDVALAEHQPWSLHRAGQRLAAEEMPIQQAAATGREVAADDLEFRLDDGRVIRTAIRAAPLFDRNGEVRGALGAIRDITASLELEERLRLHAAQLEMIDLRKDEFLATLAHELRTPLATIRNAVGVLQHSGTEDRNLIRVRNLIDRQVSQLNRLVEDLLDGARIIQGKIKLEREPLCVGQLLELAHEAAQPALDARCLELQLQCPDSGVEVFGDKVRLVQVLTNLLVNAAKFSHEKSRVWVTVQEETGQVAVRVRDEGIGIPADLLPVIFDLFIQGARPGDKSEVGLGIGLSLVKRLTTMHGGQVEARSEGEGKGSEFVVRLPLHRAG